MILKIYVFLCFLNIFDLRLVSIVSYRIVLDVSTFVNWEFKTSQISCIRSSCRIFPLELRENIVVVVKMGEYHHINLFEAPLDLVLGTREVIQDIEKQTGHREQKDHDNPDQLKYAVMVSRIDAESYDQSDSSHTDIKRREIASEII